MRAVAGQQWQGHGRADHQPTVGLQNRVDAHCWIQPRFGGCRRIDDMKFRVWRDPWRFVCHLLVEVGARRFVRAAPVMVPPPVAFDVLVVDGSRSAGGFELGEQVFGRCRGRGDGLTHRHQVGGDVAVAEVPGCRL